MRKRKAQTENDSQTQTENDSQTQTENDSQTRTENDSQTRTENDSGSELEGPSYGKRVRRKTKRFTVKHESGIKPSQLTFLTQELKKWTETNLTRLSHTMQWDVDCPSDIIAAGLEKTPEEVDKLLDLIMKTRWDVLSTKGGIFDEATVLKKDATNPILKNMILPVDFWRHICSALTPAGMNNTSEIAAVMKDIASNSDDEYGPIYEFIALALDDPAGTFHQSPSLSPVQSGIMLEIMYNLAIDAKQHSHRLNDYLCERALAALAGDWAALKMPDPDAEELHVQKKRLALQSLNPFAMARSSVPAVQSELMPADHSTDPMRVDLRPLHRMTRLVKGYTTTVVPTEGASAAPANASRECPMRRNFIRRKVPRKKANVQPQGTPGSVDVDEEQEAEREEEREGEREEEEEEEEEAEEEEEEGEGEEAEEEEEEEGEGEEAEEEEGEGEEAEEEEEEGEGEEAEEEGDNED